MRQIPLSNVPRFVISDLEQLNCCHLPFSVSFRQVWAKLCFRKRAIKMLLSNERPRLNCTGTVNVQGDASGRSKLIVQTLPASLKLCKQSTLGLHKV